MHFIFLFQFPGEFRQLQLEFCLLVGNVEYHHTLWSKSLHNKDAEEYAVRVHYQLARVCANLAKRLSSLLLRSSLMTAFELQPSADLIEELHICYQLDPHKTEVPIKLHDLENKKIIKKLIKEIGILFDKLRPFKIDMDLPWEELSPLLTSKLEDHLKKERERVNNVTNNSANDNVNGESNTPPVNSTNGINESNNVDTVNNVKCEKHTIVLNNKVNDESNSKSNIRENRADSKSIQQSSNRMVSSQPSSLNVHHTDGTFNISLSNEPRLFKPIQINSNRITRHYQVRRRFPLNTRYRKHPIQRIPARRSVIVGAHVNASEPTRDWVGEEEISESNELMDSVDTQQMMSEPQVVPTVVSVEDVQAALKQSTVDVLQGASDTVVMPRQINVEPSNDTVVGGGESSPPATIVASKQQLSSQQPLHSRTPVDSKLDDTTLNNTSEQCDIVQQHVDRACEVDTISACKHKVVHSKETCIEYKEVVGAVHSNFFDKVSHKRQKNSIRTITKGCKGDSTDSNGAKAKQHSPKKKKKANKNKKIKKILTRSQRKLRPQRQ